MTPAAREQAAMAAEGAGAVEEGSVEGAAESSAESTTEGTTESTAESTAAALTGPARGIAERLERGETVARPLAGGGALYLDRPLPFLLVYRRPPGHGRHGRRDLGAARLVTSEACHLVAESPGDAEILPAAVAALASRFPQVLVLEVWTRPQAEEEGPPQADGSEPPFVPGEAPPPAFRVFRGAAPAPAAPGSSSAGSTAPPEPTSVALAAALREIALDDRAARVEVIDAPPAPPGLPPLGPPGSASLALPSSVVHVGVEVAPVFRACPEGPLYPPRYDLLRRQWHLALAKALFAFCRRQPESVAHHYLALGRRGLPEALWEIDRTLAEVGEGFDFLLQVTPVNAAEAWERFQAAGCQGEPSFRYRPVPVDVELMKRRLYDIPLERIEDPTLTLLFREKQEELDRQLTMLAERGTRRFYHGSMALFGEVDDDLVATARAVLDRVPDRPLPGDRLGAAEFATLARREIDQYRRVVPDLPDLVEVRDDMHRGVMVSRGHLLIGDAFSVSRFRAEALVHHEVGTHVLTYLNGRAQRFRQLYLGFAGYESLQEGMAVLAEYLVGGLTPGRLRTLAGRVLAARALVDGADFTATWRLLAQVHGFAPEIAFTVVLRIARGGGFTKDKVYLEGLRDLLAYLAEGGELEPLYVGKIAAAHVPVVEELQMRGVLGAMPLQPRFLFDTGALARLEAVRRGLTVAELDLSGGEET